MSLNVAYLITLGSILNEASKNSYNYSYATSIQSRLLRVIRVGDETPEGKALQLFKDNLKTWYQSNCGESSKVLKCFEALNLSKEEVENLTINFLDATTKDGLITELDTLFLDYVIVCQF